MECREGELSAPRVAEQGDVDIVQLVASVEDEDDKADVGNDEKSSCAKNMEADTVL